MICEGNDLWTYTGTSTYMCMHIRFIDCTVRHLIGEALHLASTNHLRSDLFLTGVFIMYHLKRGKNSKNKSYHFCHKISFIIFFFSFIAFIMLYDAACLLCEDVIDSIKFDLG